jgi:hypothetical protein
VLPPGKAVLRAGNAFWLEQAWYVSISRPNANWASTPDIQVDVTNMTGFLPRQTWFHLPD